MADNLIPYVEFLGLSGSGKSFFSHKVAEMLRLEGYKIAEPSWELDHTDGKYIRAIKKTMMVWMFIQGHHREAEEIKSIIKSCGLTNSEKERFYRNILYKAYLLNKESEDVLFFDEGIAQMAVSLSIKALKPAGQIYNELIDVLSLNKRTLLVRIDCNIETALLNMNARSTHDSYVEKLTGLGGKKEYLKRYKEECESISGPHSLIAPYNQDTTEVVQTIAKFIKIQLEKQ